MPALTNPMIVQSDRTVLLEVQNPLYEAARDTLTVFAELEKSPEYMHTYRISPLSLWNAASAGLSAPDVLAGLTRYSKFPLPEAIQTEIRQLMSRYGLVKLEQQDGHLFLTSSDRTILLEITHHKDVIPLLGTLKGPDRSEILAEARGHLKEVLMKLGYPVEDLAGYNEGTPLPFSWRSMTLGGEPFALRDYQLDAVESFHLHGSLQGGSGVLVLPCGSGKTLIGIGVMEKLQVETLILTTNVTSARQWLRELADKTNLTPEQLSEYSGEHKGIAPVTVATYQILTYRDAATSTYPHFELFNQKNWGLIIYDEVHLLPAPVFRATAELQAKRRLGLTATLIREDGKEDEVFTLIGPKKKDLPWKVLEAQGWIASAQCTEWRIPMSKSRRIDYALAEEREKFRLAAENPRKTNKVAALLDRHPTDHILIIGQYVQQLEFLAKELRAPLITGKTPQKERERLYQKFREGEIHVLIVSKVGNFAVDLPDANVAIQVSGSFGSRQEEAQRLGRILRPKKGDPRAYFYSLVSRDTKEQEFGMKRQLFLTEQGYSYQIAIEEDPDD